MEHGNVVDEALATHSEYMRTAFSSESSSTSPMLIEKPKDEDAPMKEANIEKCMNASATAAKQLGIHILRTAYRCVKQYNMSPDSIFDSIIK
ncbi:hypothetical protein, partial, partial [Parasitella parasitica]